MDGQGYRQRSGLVRGRARDHLKRLREDRAGRRKTDGAGPEHRPDGPAGPPRDPMTVPAISLPPVEPPAEDPQAPTPHGWTSPDEPATSPVAGRKPEPALVDGALPPAVQALGPGSADADAAAGTASPAPEPEDVPATAKADLLEPMPVAGDAPEPSSGNDGPPVLETDLFRLPGAGSGLVWMLQNAGVRTLDDLAATDAGTLSADLGVVAQILDVSYWIDWAKTHAEPPAP